MQSFSSIFKYESMKMDNELYKAYPEVFEPPIHRPTSTSMYLAQKLSNHEESPEISQEQGSSPQAAKDEGLSASNETEFSSISVGKLKKRKVIKKGRKDSQSNQNSISEARNARRSKAAKPTYPTKNFLPNFKGPHLCYLESYLGRGVNEHPFIQYLRKKDGISLKDYENLYNMEEFSEAFESMFRCRYLYRELLLSRSDRETKKIHHRKLNVFEEAFRSKSFTKIN